MLTRASGLCRALAFGAALAAAGTAFAAYQDDAGMGGPPAPPAPPAPPPPPAPPVPAAPAGQDVLVLHDGTEIRGRILDEDESGYSVKIGGSRRLVEKDLVKEVRRGAPGAAEADPGMDAGGDAAERERKRARAKRRAEGDAPAAAPLTAEGEAWARLCVERVLAGDAAVQRSAAEALRALGPAALPVIRAARDEADEKGKALLDRLAAATEQGPGKRKGADGAPPAVPPGLAKKGATERPGPRAVMERVRTELGLDDASSRSVGLELLRFGRELRETMMDARDGLVTYEDARTKVGDLRAKLRESLRATLNEEQLGKLDGILDDMAPKKAGPPPAKPKGDEGRPQ